MTYKELAPSVSVNNRINKYKNVVVKILKQDKQSPQKQLKDCFIRNEIKTTKKK